MFGTGHPRPLHRKEVAMHVVRQEARRLDSHTLTVDVPDAPRAAHPPGPAPIRFDVVYTLPEYLGFLRDHLAFLLRRAPAGVRLRRTAVPLACAALAAAFAWLAGPGALRTTLAASAALALACLPATAGMWIALVGTPRRLVMQLSRGRFDIARDAVRFGFTGRDAGAAYLDALLARIEAAFPLAAQGLADDWRTTLHARMTDNLARLRGV